MLPSHFINYENIVKIKITAFAVACTVGMHGLVHHRSVGRVPPFTSP